MNHCEYVSKKDLCKTMEMELLQQHVKVFWCPIWSSFYFFDLPQLFWQAIAQISHSALGHHPNLHLHLDDCWNPLSNSD